VRCCACRAPSAGPRRCQPPAAPARVGDSAADAATHTRAGDRHISRRDSGPRHPRNRPARTELTRAVGDNRECGTDHREGCARRRASPRARGEARAANWVPQMMRKRRFFSPRASPAPLPTAGSTTQWPGRTTIAHLLARRGGLSGDLPGRDQGGHGPYCRRLRRLTERRSRSTCAIRRSHRRCVRGEGRDGHSGGRSLRSCAPAHNAA